MLAGADIAPEGAADAPIRTGLASSRVRGSARPSRVMRSPEGLARIDPGGELRGTLRPYQHIGLRWLLSGLGLGACLGDDMGLGKTLQVLALLLVQRGVRDAEPAHPAFW